MTCIVGLVDNGTVWMGGDSAGVAGMDLVVRKDPKVFRVGRAVIGGTSSFRMLQLLQFAETEENPCYATPLVDPYEFAVRKFVPWMRKLFLDGGFSRKYNNVETGGVFLIGYFGRLFRIDDDFQVGEAACGFDACGCGENLARGSLATGELLGSAEYRVEKALQVAEKFSAGVRGPFTILSLEAANA